ncbi:hypothetical protein BDP55DRAFT_689865 [Colletotrichum godetiae]|uniref:Glycosyltransferase family 25 protein n=1 Tax=Colletotrichum godetiae TaxID=1209918 RepID=A0AAJ0AZU8_9PEZI|nr:uncharacterized protein BDP55DRAFT_689865 [Colletotrichum godetiae]KAK1699833.1 hypothetical protein BDP55DRAFT_689865 [Colletotrichum godetiae]
MIDFHTYFLYLLSCFSQRVKLNTWHRVLVLNINLPFSKVTNNSTFGFPKIFFINISTRFDLLDAATIQAFLSGVQFEVFPAVEANMIKDRGMPPTHDKDRLRGAEKGCWRAHANIWSHMLREELPSALISEGGAAWDIHVRTIMTNFHEHFTALLHQLNSTQTPNVGRLEQAAAAADGSAQPVFPDPQDPWHSRHWDFLSLGHCAETPLNHDLMIRYDDEHVPPGPKSYYGLPLGSERVVRKSGGIACTTTYAVSRSGAAKLLLRTATDLDLPVDLVIKLMILSGDLVAYSVQPTTRSHWKYVPGIGTNLRGSNSDVQESRQEVEDDEDPKAPMEYFVDAALKEMTLQVAWRRIFGGERPPSQVTGV